VIHAGVVWVWEQDYMEMVSPGFKRSTEEALLVNPHPPATA